MDDIILNDSDLVEMSNLKSYAQEFEIKDLGMLKYFLSIEVALAKGGLVISQQKYIGDLQKETGLLGCKPVKTLIERNNKLGGSKEELMVARGAYQRLEGKLFYLFFFYR